MRQWEFRNGMIEPSKVPTFLDSLQNQGRILKVSSENALFMRKNFNLDNPIYRSEVFDKTSSIFPSLSQKSPTFKGVQQRIDISKIRAFKFLRKTINNEEFVCIDFAFSPCRDYCSLCLHGEMFCDNIIHYKMKLSKNEFLQSFTTEQRNLRPRY